MRCSESWERQYSETENIAIYFFSLNDWTAKQHPTIEKAWEEREEKYKERKCTKGQDEGSRVVSIEKRECNS